MAVSDGPDIAIAVCISCIVDQIRVFMALVPSGENGDPVIPRNVTGYGATVHFDNNSVTSDVTKSAC